jgi:hypothetical protein
MIILPRVLAALFVTFILACSGPAFAQRIQLSKDDATVGPNALDVISFVEDRQLGIAKVFVDRDPKVIPGTIVFKYRSPDGRDRYFPIEILTNQQRAELVAVSPIDDEVENRVDLMLSQKEGGKASLLSFLGVEFSKDQLMHFRFGPILRSNGPTYGVGNTEVTAAIEKAAGQLAEKGIESWYVNGVTLYRSRVDAYNRQSGKADAGFSFVSGGGYYKRDDTSTVQKTFLVFDAVPVYNIQALVSATAEGEAAQQYLEQSVAQTLTDSAKTVPGSDFALAISNSPELLAIAPSE